MKHPAKFSAPILAILNEIVQPMWRVLDPFAGVGLIHTLPCRTVGVEIEPEWAHLHPDTEVGNALHLRWRPKTFDAIITSPCYGNRFADHHRAKDGSTRRSYTHDMQANLGDPEHQLHEDNAGTLKFPGAAYEDFHRRAWTEAVRVLRPRGDDRLRHPGLFVLNTKDFYADRQLVELGAWHRHTLEELGLHHIDTIAVPTSGLRYGENRERVDHEDILVMEKI